MKSLAIFIHYSRDGKVCPNAMLYASELKRFFDIVVISSNIMIYHEDPAIISLCFTKNGYDFGYFYQAIEVLDALNGEYHTIGFFNDSNYIIKPLGNEISWCLDNDLDLCGITDCWVGRPEIKENNQYHIQSHFIVFKNKSISYLKEYLEKYKIENIIYNVADAFTKRANVIIYYEILLSLYMKEKGIKMGAYYDSLSFIKDHSNLSRQVNTHMILWKELIDDGYPFIKRKLVNQNFTKQDYKDLMNTKGMTSMNLSKSIISKKGEKKFINTIL